MIERNANALSPLTQPKLFNISTICLFFSNDDWKKIPFIIYGVTVPNIIPSTKLNTIYRYCSRQIKLYDLPNVLSQRKKKKNPIEKIMAKEKIPWNNNRVWFQFDTIVDRLTEQKKTFILFAIIRCMKTQKMRRTIPTTVIHMEIDNGNERRWEKQMLNCHDTTINIAQ